MNFYTNILQMGDHLYIRGFEDGERIQRKVVYEPHLFVSSDRETGYKSIDDKHVKRVDFDKMSDAREFIRKYSDVVGMDIYGYDKWPYLYIYENYKDMQYDTSKINVVGLDIEVASDDGFPEPGKAEKEVTAITLKRKNMTIVIGCGNFVHDQKDLYYMKCEDERALLQRFLKVWESLEIDVVTGWNTEFFDIPYLVHRIEKLFDKKSASRLSPWNKIKQYSMSMGTKEQIGYNIFGVSNLDYLAVYRKFQLAPRESYRLDYICEVELGEKKLDYSEFGNLHSLYKENYQKFIEYNIRDVDLIFMLEEKLGYIEQIFALTFDSRVNHEDGLTTLTIWDTIIHNYLMDRNIVIPNKRPDIRDNPQIEGGFVKDPKVGMHEWIMSFDLNSLYPHLIMQYNISPDTRVKNDEKYWELTAQANVDSLLKKSLDTSILKQNNVSMTANGKIYSNQKRGFLSELMKMMYDGRVEYKKKMIDFKKEYEKNPSRELEIEISRSHNMQFALKILLNSAYGAIANKYFRWFEQDNAEAITVSGQLSIRWIEKAINEYMNKLLKTEDDYVIAVDTDSVYICFDALVKSVMPNAPKEQIVDFLDKVASEKIEPFIDKKYQELREYMNAFEQKMIMKRENIGDKAIWTAKKRYIMNVHDSEGVRYAEPKLKIMGIEAIRSSTPPICREYIIDTLNIIMHQDERDVQDYIKNIRDNFHKLPFEKIAFPRGVNFTTRKRNFNGDEYIDTYADNKTIYKKATPIQVKGALLYNHYLNKYGLDKTYEEIKDGEKIKFCYLTIPNPIKDKVIACPDTLPKEFKLEEFIDYEMQFVKGYLDPIETILNVIGWNSERVSTLEGLFQ